MFKRRTTKIRHRKQAIRLQAHVMSPRIAWFGFVGAISNSLKIFLLLALLAAAAWGCWLGVQKAVLNNQEFQLQAIRLTPNSAMDEGRLVQVANININGTLFDCDLGDMEKRLVALPEVASADVKREFPGTLLVKVVAREPLVWIACKRATDPILPRDPKNGLLADRGGFLYRCPAGQLEKAAGLPVIEINPDCEGADALTAGQKVTCPDYERALALHEAACEASEDADTWIDSIRQSKSWALELTARDGMKATFGLGDHARQMQDLIAAVRQSRTDGTPIATISLIPHNHLPVTLKDGSPPRAMIVAEPEHPKGSPARRDTDLKQLLNRR